MADETRQLKVDAPALELLRDLAALDRRSMKDEFSVLVEREHALRFSTPNPETKLDEIAKVQL